MKSEFLSGLSGIALKATPPVGVIAAAHAGVNWQKWVWIVTFLYVGLQLGLLVWDRLVKPFMRRGTGAG